MSRRWPGRAALGAIVAAAVAGSVAAGLGAGAQTAPAGPGAGAQTGPAGDVRLGQALFGTHCAVCHGEAGRGDGPAAAGLASKPADLTQGRRLNQLPDEYFSSVVLHGGAAEGLAPTMPPFRNTLNAAQVGQIVAYVRTLAVPPFAPAQARPIVSVPGAPAQPIAFSHLVHAGSYQIACEHCHADARRASAAGLPSVERCMGCHKIIGAQDNPEIQKIHAYWNRREPIPWVRVFKVPEYSYFPHKAHVRAEVACQRCHGPIERMRVVGAVTGQSLGNDLLNLVGLRPVPVPLTMGWCIDCHREQNATRRTQAPLDCVACHH